MSLRKLSLALLLSFFVSVAAKAQSDTAVFELGRVDLPKKFSQSVTIKAADLEKIPFTNLSDVITTWLYGYYGDKRSYLYVVDGILNTDVNAYSIFDIDEITMVQNASIYVNGALPGQVLLVVKTRRNAKPGVGVKVNGQTNMVTLRNVTGNGAKSTTGYYSQYYASAYKSTGKISAGVSASFQHNPFPIIQFNSSSPTPYNSDRFKFNGYFDAKLGSANVLHITAGYVPQNDDLKLTQLSFTQQGQVAAENTASGNQNLLYGNLGLTTNITKGLVNKLSVGYQRHKTKMHSLQSQMSYFIFNGSFTTTTSTTESDTSHTAKSFLVNDNLSYNLHAGKLSITPAVNFAYRKLTDSGSLFGTLLTGGFPSTYSFKRTRSFRTSEIQLMPSVTLNYDDVVMLQTGFQKPLRKEIYGSYPIKQKDVLPFANIGIDVLKAAGVADKNTALLFSGSYAKSLGVSTEQNGPLSDQIIFYTNSGYSYNPSVDFNRKYDQFQAGLSLSLFQNRLSFSYNYQLVKGSTFIAMSQFLSPSVYYIEYYQFDKRTHVNRFEINADILNKTALKWRSSLNVNLFKQNISSTNKQSNQPFIVLPGQNLTTGGMINRLSYKKFTGGLDILYCFNQERMVSWSNNGPVYSKYTSFSLQNVYVGYQFKTHRLKDIEVYANAHNLLQNPASTITDNRRFYGLGFKTNL